MAITLAELVYSELIGLVQRTRVSYPACFNKIRLTENMVDKRESYTKEDLLASGRGELFGAKGPQLPAPNMLMMDRVVKMTETGGNFDKGYVEAERAHQRGYQAGRAYATKRCRPTGGRSL